MLHARLRRPCSGRAGWRSAFPAVPVTGSPEDRLGVLEAVGLFELKSRALQRLSRYRSRATRNPKLPGMGLIEQPPLPMSRTKTGM